MVRVTFILLLLTADVQAEDMVNLAITSYKSGESHKATSILKEISSQSGQFKRSIETLMKIYYKEHLWPRVFGLGTFYRHNFNNHADFSMDVASLEVLALAQNCQYELAQKLMESLTQAHGKKLGYKALQENLKIAKSYGLKEDKLKEVTFQTTGERWKLDKSEFSRLGDPYRLEVKVENKCKS